MTTRPKKNTEEQPGEPESFEEAIERLEELVSELEAGNVPLEKSLSAFEEGQILIKYCEKKLNAAEKMLKKISLDASEAMGEQHPHSANPPETKNSDS
jgi:exodeoxyribonuclease VII small subunit